MMMISREKLLELGFRREVIPELENEIGLVLYLKQGKDRFLHRLRWHELGEPEELLIDCLYLRGWETIDEEDFLNNTNGLSSNAIEHYKEILEKLGDTNRKEKVIEVNEKPLEEIDIKEIMSRIVTGLIEGMEKEIE